MALQTPWPGMKATRWRRHTRGAGGREGRGREESRGQVAGPGRHVWGRAHAPPEAAARRRRWTSGGVSRRAGMDASVPVGGAGGLWAGLVRRWAGPPRTITLLLKAQCDRVVLIHPFLLAARPFPASGDVCWWLKSAFFNHCAASH